MISGERIKAIREKRGESQAAFARHFPVNQATIHRWEAEGVRRSPLMQTAIEERLAALEMVEAAE